MWIVEYNCPGRAIQRITGYEWQDYALVAASASIMLVVTNDWDRTRPGCQSRALLISDACSNLNWHEAIRLFNDWEAGEGPSTMQHYRVYELLPKTNIPVVHLLSATQQPSVPTMPVTPAKPAAPAVWKATAPGATCRGPCKGVSTDAYADQPDGTYHCYQCKMFSQVFGKPKP